MRKLSSMRQKRTGRTPLLVPMLNARIPTRVTLFDLLCMLKNSANSSAESWTMLAQEMPGTAVRGAACPVCRAYPQSPYNPVRRRRKQLEQRHRQAKRSREDVPAEGLARAAREVYKRACMESRRGPHSPEDGVLQRSSLCAVSRFPCAGCLAPVSLHVMHSAFIQAHTPRIWIPQG